MPRGETRSTTGCRLRRRARAPRADRTGVLQSPMRQNQERAQAAVTGWVEDWSCFGVRVGRRWVPWAIGGVARPRPGEYAEVAVDDEGCATSVAVRASRPGPPSPN